MNFHLRIGFLVTVLFIFVLANCKYLLVELDGEEEKDPVTKPGQCPKQEGGLCDSGWTCTDDNQCPRDLKCCSNECGGTCLPPVTLIPNQICARLSEGCCPPYLACPPEADCCEGLRCQGFGKIGSKCVTTEEEIPEV